MIATRLVVVLATLPAAQDTATHTDTVVNLAFDYPKAWSVARKRDTATYSLPIPESSSKAELEVIRTPFHSSKEVWQTIQQRINEQLKREVVRQWEQEVIEVPMLLTQVNWNEKGVAKTTLTGLYYTRTAVKLQFKLTAPSDEFQKAQLPFNEVLQSLRTLDGSKPLEDDETVKLEPPKKAPPPPPKRKTIDVRNDAARNQPKVDVPLTVSTKPVLLRLPAGWRAEDIQEGKLVLRHDEVSGPIAVEVRSTLDSEPPRTALFKLSSASLNEFSAVTRREDVDDRPNALGCRITTVWRIGKSEKGDLIVHESAGAQGEFYFLATYRLTNPGLLNAEQRRIRTLLDLISLEPQS